MPPLKGSGNCQGALDAGLKVNSAITSFRLNLRGTVPRRDLVVKGDDPFITEKEFKRMKGGVSSKWIFTRAEEGGWLNMHESSRIALQMRLIPFDQANPVQIRQEVRQAHAIESLWFLQP